VLFWPNLAGVFFVFLLGDFTKSEVSIMDEGCAVVTNFHALGILFLSAPLGVKL